YTRRPCRRAREFPEVRIDPEAWFALPTPLSPQPPETRESYGNVATIAMQPQTGFGDFSYVPKDGHGNPCCTHECRGPAQTGSPDVFVNDRNAVRVTDTGIHAKCCGPNTWVAM